jgi:hypothetical protein
MATGDVGRFTIVVMGSDRGQLGVPEDRKWTGPSGDGPVHIVVPASLVPTLHQTRNIPDADTVLFQRPALHAAQPARLASWSS